MPINRLPEHDRMISLRDIGEEILVIHQNWPEKLPERSLVVRSKDYCIHLDRGKVTGHSEPKIAIVAKRPARGAIGDVGDIRIPFHERQTLECVGTFYGKPVYSYHAMSCISPTNDKHYASINEQLTKAGL